jgi:hypothetical protein
MNTIKFDFLLLLRNRKDSEYGLHYYNKALRSAMKILSKVKTAKIEQ